MIYVLLLERGKLYVGYSQRPTGERFKEHFAGGGSQWTTLHRPLQVLYIDEGEFRVRLWCIFLQCLRISYYMITRSRRRRSGRGGPDHLGTDGHVRLVECTRGKLVSRGHALVSPGSTVPAVSGDSNGRQRFSVVHPVRHFVLLLLLLVPVLLRLLVPVFLLRLWQQAAGEPTRARGLSTMWLGLPRNRKMSCENPPEWSRPSGNG